MSEKDELAGLEPKNKEALNKKEEELADRERHIRERERELRTGVESASIQEQIEAAVEEKKAKKGGGFNLTGIIISVVLAAIIAYIMIGQFAISKGWYNTNIAPVLNSLADTYAKKGALVDFVTKGDFSQYATKDDLSQYVLTSDLPLAPDLSGYVSIATYNSKVTSLEARIAELGAGGGGDGGGTPTGDVKVEVKDYTSDYFIEVPEGTVETLSPYYFEEEIAKLTITNSTGSDIEDVRLIVEIELSTSLPSSDYEAMISDGGDWTLTSQSRSSMKFKSSRFDMDAGDVEKFYIVLVVEGTNSGVARDVEFDNLTAEVEDFSIVS